MANDRLGPKSVTLFGGAGFIGRHIVGRMAKRGWQIRIASRRPNRALFLKPSGAVGQIAPVFANLRDEASVAAAVDGVDYVLNLVGILYEGGRQTFQELHTEGAAQVAKAAKAAGAQRLIHVSAIGSSPDSPSIYARTKAAGERAALEAFAGTTVLRPSVVFGPEDSFFNLFGGLARMSPFLPLFGGGKTRFQPVYVGDVADAAMACLDDPATSGRTYELGGPKVYSYRDLMELVLRETKRKRLLLPVPWGIAKLQASVLGLLPQPLLTRDQVTQLQIDNVVSPDALTLNDLGIEPTPAEVVVPTYLGRFRRGGRFADQRLA